MDISNNELREIAVVLKKCNFLDPGDNFNTSKILAVIKSLGSKYEFSSLLEGAKIFAKTINKRTFIANKPLYLKRALISNITEYEQEKQFIEENNADDLIEDTAVAIPEQEEMTDEQFRKLLAEF